MVNMYEELQGKGFEILAFPCNQFFGQESGSQEEILAFVKDNFNVKFRLFEKIEVNGANTHPLYTYLRLHSELFDKNTKSARVIPWNFAKFLVDRKGEVFAYFTPNDGIEKVRAAILE